MTHSEFVKLTEEVKAFLTKWNSPINCFSFSEKKQAVVYCLKGERYTVSLTWDKDYPERVYLYGDPEMEMDDHEIVHEFKPNPHEIATEILNLLRVQEILANNDLRQL